MSIPILLYHQVSEVTRVQDPYKLASSPAQFAEQMAYLHQAGFRCVSLKEVAEAFKTGKKLPKKSFAITFDDGYRDNYEIALPIMQKHGFTATIFLVADCVGGMTNWEGQSDERSFPLMTWDEIHAMQAAGVDFGSHTSTHPRLTKLTPAQVKQELCESKQKLEAGLGKTVDLLAYPYEASAPDVQQAALECGYLGACGTSSHAQTIYNLWRVEFGAEDDLASLKRKLSRWWYPLMELKRQARPIKKLLRG